MPQSPERLDLLSRSILSCVSSSWLTCSRACTLAMYPTRQPPRSSPAAWSESGPGAGTVARPELRMPCRKTLLMPRARRVTRAPRPPMYPLGAIPTYTPGARTTLPMTLVLEGGGLSREDGDRDPLKDALCLWRGMLGLALEGNSTTTRGSLIPPSASLASSRFAESTGFWFPTPASLWPGHAPLWKLLYPQSSLYATFHAFPSFTELKGR